MHTVLLVIAVLAASELYRLMTRTLRAGSERRKEARSGRGAFTRRTVEAVAISLLTGLLSIGAFEAPPFYFDPYPEWSGWQPLSPPKRWLYAALNWINRARYGNLAEAKLSIRPSSWNGKDLTVVEGATFRRVQLPYADFEGAFLVNADFRGAMLDGANFANADLRGAKFEDVVDSRSVPASMNGVIFSDTKLDSANLSHLDLRTAMFTSGTSLAGTGLAVADLRGVALPGVNMRGANLFHADLRGAVLNGVDLRDATLFATNMDGAQLANADLTSDTLSFVCLARTNLSRVKLIKANLRGSNLLGANLQGADLRGAILRGDRRLPEDIVDSRDAMGLSHAQVQSAIVDGTTQLPFDLPASDRKPAGAAAGRNDPCVEP